MMYLEVNLSKDITGTSDMLLEHLMMYLEVNLSKNITGYSG